MPDGLGARSSSPLEVDLVRSEDTTWLIADQEGDPRSRRGPPYRFADGDHGGRLERRNAERERDRHESSSRASGDRHHRILIAPELITTILLLSRSAA